MSQEPEHERDSASTTLTTDQFQAIQLLVIGKSNTDVAQTLGKDRRTIYRWCQNPHFIAELNRQRKDIYDSGQIRLHGLMHKAISVLEEQLDKANLKAAMEVLKLLNVTPKTLKPDFETNAEIIACKEAEKLAYSAITAAPFEKESIGIPSQRRGLKALANDIFRILVDKHQINTSLDELNQ